MPLPLTPVIVASIGGVETVIPGVTGADPNLLYYSLTLTGNTLDTLHAPVKHGLFGARVAPSGGVITGTYAVNGPNVGQYSFTATGTVTPYPVLIYEVITVVPNDDDRHYQVVPEDELEQTYFYVLDDSYPWRRALPAGGEQIKQSVENADVLSLRQILMENVIQITDEAQQVYDVTGVDFNPADRGYCLLIQNTVNATGQRPIGFQITGSIQPEDGETEHDGSLSTVSSNQLGIPYEISAVRGILVADGPAHWGTAQSNQLVMWYHLGEHPQQPYLISDFSDVGLTESDIESGSFSSNYFLADRVWDDSRGWMLRLRGQTPTQLPGFFTINKNRFIGNDYTISFWIKASVAASPYPETLVFQYGPVVLMFGQGGGAGLQTYVKDGVTGNLRSIGSVLAVNATTPTFYSLSVSSLNPTSFIPADACTTANVASLYGLQVIDGVQLICGQSILLVGQTTQTQNGHYFVSTTGWIRVEAVNGVDEHGQYFKVNGGVANSGFYQNTNGSAITYGTTNVTYARCNCTWHGTLGGPTQDILQPFQASDSLFTFTAPAVLTSSDITIGDLRIWSIGKTATELALIENPPVKPASLAARPTFFLSTRGTFRSFQVLSSGYVFPGVRPIDYYAERLSRALRYNGSGEYVGPDNRLMVGYGDLKPVTSTLTLGLEGPDLSSQGTGIGASTSSDLPGFNPFWYADTTPGNYRTVPVPYITGSDADNSQLVTEPTSSYHPTEMPVQNPDQNRIFIAGDDGNMYRIVVQVVHTNAGDTVTLVPQLAGQQSTSAQQTPQNYALSSEEGTVETVLNPGFYGLVAAYPTDNTLQPDFVTDAETCISCLDLSACNVIIADGGGDTFDCYFNGAASSLPNGGTAWNGTWKVGDNSNLYYDFFDSYANGPATSLSAGFGFNGSWEIGDNPFGECLGDSFDSYIDGPAYSGMTSGTGFTGMWQFS